MWTKNVVRLVFKLTSDAIQFRACQQPIYDNCTILVHGNWRLKSWETQIINN